MRIDWDGGVIDTNVTEKCDYMFFDENYKNVFFIELKGTDIPHAFEQIMKSISLLKPELEIKAGHKKLNIVGRIIGKGFPSGVFNLPSTKKFLDEFKKLCKSKLIIREVFYEENLSVYY